MDVKQLLEAKGRALVFLNIRSLLANINVLRCDFQHSKIMAIGISESWLNSKTHDQLVSIDGFKIVRHDRQYNKRGGGLRSILTMQSRTMKLCLTIVMSLIMI